MRRHAAIHEAGDQDAAASVVQTRAGEDDAACDRENVFRLLATGERAAGGGITNAVTTTLGHGEEAVSVAVEDVNPRDWAEKVYRPDVLETSAELYKRPGYDPFA